MAARRFGLPEKRAVLWASLWALGALFLGPFLRGSADLSADYQLAWSDLVLASVAGLLTAGVLTVVRLIARPLQGLQQEGRPVLWLLLVGGAAIGAVGVVYHNVTGQPVDLALTSGEQMIKTLLGLGTVGAIVAAVLAKAVVYAISLGAGFRGGAYFPALFVGAGCGAALAMQFDGSVPAGATAGLVASVTYLSQVRWGAVAVLAVVIGLMAGGWALLPVSLVAAVVGRLVPRVDPPEAPEENRRESAAAGAPPA